jgi:hypothetical protein
LRSWAHHGLITMFGITLVLLGLTGCGVHASLPPDEAGPAVVLTAYLTALKAGDCDSAHQLAAASFTESNGDLCGNVRVSAFSPLLGPATPKDGEVVFSTELTTSGGDFSMRDGQHTVFYTLDRQTNGAWRISGGGSGP